MATKNDKIILALKKQIEEKKAFLGKKQKFEPVTNCNLELDGRRYNLHVETKDTLLLLIGKLVSIKSGLASVMPDETLNIGGFNVNQWIEDLKNKHAISNLTTEERRLKKLEDELHELLSIDTKVELKIDDLKSQI